VEKLPIPKIKKYSDRLLLLVYPVFLLGVNSTWIFTPVTNFLPDPWFYFAYFRYFYDYAPAYPSNIHYFVERITWNVPGYTIHRLLPPILANYALHLLVYYVAVFSLYGILNHLAGRRAAFLGALLLGSYPWFLRAAGWDYVDGAGIAHTLLLLYLLTVAPHSKYGHLLFVLAGTVNASLILTNMFWVGFTPSWLVYFVLLNYRSKWFDPKRIAFAAIQFAVGNAAVVGLAAAFSKVVFGRYSYFFRRSLDFAEMVSQSSENVREVIRIYGHMAPYWHIVPLLIAITAAGMLVLKNKNANPDYLMAAAALFSTAYGFLIFWHIFRIPFLIVFLYSSFVIPSVFVLLGMLLAEKLNPLTDPEFQSLSILGALALVVPPSLAAIEPPLINLQGSVPLLTTFCCALLLGFLYFNGNRAGAAIIVSFSMLFFLGAKGSYVYAAERFKARDNFSAILDAARVIDSHFPNREYEDFRLWFRADEDYDTFFSLASIYLYPWGSTLGAPYSGKPAPEELMLNRYNKIEEGDQIVILSSVPDADRILEEANRALAERNAAAVLNAIGEIRQGTTEFFIYFTSVSSMP
jgi:hypothetical protein